MLILYWADISVCLAGRGRFNSQDIEMPYPEPPRRSYLTMRPFEFDLFTYVTSFDAATYQTTGSLVPIVNTLEGDPEAICPQGRVLRENGKKLYPGGAYPGVYTYMVGVYDAVSFLSGYIDPNSQAFTPVNTDKPVTMYEAVPGTLGISPSLSDSDPNDQGPPVYTHGDLLAGGRLVVGESATIGGNADISGNVAISGDLEVVGNGNVVCNRLRLGAGASSLGPIKGGGFLVTPGTVVAYRTVALDISTFTGLMPDAGCFLIIQPNTSMATGLLFTGYQIRNSTTVRVNITNNTGADITDGTGHTWTYIVFFND